MKQGGWEVNDFDAGYPRYIGAAGPAPRDRSLFNDLKDLDHRYAQSLTDKNRLKNRGQGL